MAENWIPRATVSVRAVIASSRSPARRADRAQLTL